MLLGSKPLVEATRLSYPRSEVRCWSPWEAHRYFRTKRIPMKVHLDGVSETELWAQTQQRWCLQLHLERLCLTPTLKHLFLFQSDHLLSSTQIISIDLGQTKTRGRSGWTEVSLPTQQGFFLQTWAHRVLTCRVWLKRFNGVAFTGGMRLARDVTLERGLTRLLLGS